MSDQDRHALTGAYAANALTPEEERDFEQHLSACPACSQEVAELRATASRLAAAVAAPPPPALRGRVLTEVRGVRQRSPLPGGVASSRTRAERWRPVLAAAAGLLLVASATATAVHEHRVADDAERRAARIAAMVADPDGRTVLAPSASGGSGTVVTADGAALVLTRELPQLPEHQTYQLWVVAGRTPRPAGLLGRGGGDVVERYLPSVPKGASVAVTVEPRGGSRAPTTDPVLVAELPSA
jgi:anti-sigma factor RsiW